jgi:hypothetical protein
MTDHASEDGGLSFEKVHGPAQPEHAPKPSGPDAEHAAGLAFETAPRTPPPPPPTPPNATRSLVASALEGTPDPGPRPVHTFETAPMSAPPVAAAPAAGTSFQATPRPAPAPAPATHAPASFHAVPASVGVAQQRMSTATLGFRPEVAAVGGVSVPGGQGWNIRRRDEADAQRGHAEPIEPAWSTRTTEKMRADHSAWDVPAAPRRRHLSGRALVGIVLSIILIGILGFAAFEWASGRDHATVTIATPAAIGSLDAIKTPATAAVTAQMQKAMLAYGATRVVSGVYGTGGHPTLVVLLAQGPNIETSSTQFFNDFTSGLKSNGVTVDRSKTVQATTNGSQFVCSPATRPAPLGAVSLCGWDDGTTIGVVMDVSGQPVSITLTEAEQARSAGEH